MFGKESLPPLVELRRYHRTRVDLPVEFAVKGSQERFAGRATDLSVGGMFVQTEQPLAFGAELVVYAQLPATAPGSGRKIPVALPAVVRWTRAGEGMGLQFGLLGARETHAITELTKAP